ncbi:MAG: hypothetical protein MHPSP_001278 [Paramarteilia canceri]
MKKESYKVDITDLANVSCGYTTIIDCNRLRKDIYALKSEGAIIYRPILPVCNRKLQKKWDDSRRLKHVKHLDSIKSVLDQSEPREVSHLKSRLKSKQIEKERKERFSSEDKILYKKIQQVQNRNPIYCFDDSDKRFFISRHSTNLPAKKWNVLRIEKENLRIYNKLNSIKPTISRVKHLNDYKQQQKRMNKISLRGTC